MNLLGFIITLLALLSLTSSYFFHQTIASQEIKNAYRGYTIASRNAQNDLTKKLYQKVRKRKNPSQKNSYIPSSTVKKEEEKLQKLEELPECVILNVAPLIRNEKEANKEIYEYLCSLIKLLYQDSLLCSVKEKNPERYFVNLLLAGIKEEKPPSLAKISLSDPSCRLLFYKMLKGQKKGYPSLLDYIEYNPEGQFQKICLACSNRQILAALFNKKISDALWEEKEEDFDFLKIDEEKLQSLFSQHQLILSYPEMLNLISLQHKKTKPAKTLTIKGSDPQSQILIRRKAYF